MINYFLRRNNNNYSSQQKQKKKKAKRKAFLNSLGKAVVAGLEKNTKQKTQTPAHQTVAVPVAPRLLSNNALPRKCEVNTTHNWSFDWEDVNGASQYEIYVQLGSHGKTLERRMVRHSQHTFSITNKQLYLENTNITWNVRSYVNNTWSEWATAYRPLEACEVKEVVIKSEFISPSANQEMANVCDGGFTSWQFEWKPVPNAEMYLLKVGSSITRYMKKFETDQTFLAVKIDQPLSDQGLSQMATIAVKVNGKWSNALATIKFKVKSCPVVVNPPTLYDIPGYQRANCNKRNVDWTFYIRDIPNATEYAASITSKEGTLGTWKGSNNKITFSFPNAYLRDNRDFKLNIAARVNWKWTEDTSYNLQVENCPEKTKPRKSSTTTSPSSNKTTYEIGGKIMRDYTIEVKTQDKSGAGTDSNIYLTFHFKNGKSSDEFVLNPLISGDAFESGDFHRFKAKVKSYLGVPISITVRSDGKYAGAGWDLEFIKVASKKFSCNCEINKGSRKLR